MSEFHGELRLIAIDDDRVVFHRLPTEEMHLTIGRRYAAVIIEIDDQENLAPHEPERETVKRAKRNPSNVAAILAKTPAFQEWAAHELSLEGRGRLPANEDSATELIRRRCGISSRAQLDIEPAALTAFQLGVELPFYQFQARLKAHQEP